MCTPRFKKPLYITFLYIIQLYSRARGLKITLCETGNSRSRKKLYIMPKLKYSDLNKCICCYEHVHKLFIKPSKANRLSGLGAPGVV